MADPSLALPTAGVMVGPENIPPMVYEDAFVARLTEA
jgi:hypothetical protein